MADKKFLDLNGLSYYTRKLDTKKANLESPVFTGTPTINDVAIATTDTVSILLDNELDSRLDAVLEDKIGDEIIKTVGDKLDEKADINSPIFTGTPTTPAPIKGDKSLQIANTQWVDDNYIGKVGDATVNGKLTVIGKDYPLLTLKSSSPTTSGYLMNIQGNLMFGDCSSNSPSRQYYGRMVPALSKAIVGAVSIGYNPKDDKNYQKTTDYGIKFDVDVANPSSATPTIQLQCGSFFVGANGAYVGYSGSTSKALNYDTQVYRVLDSNSIKTDEYITSLEQRIAELESKISELAPQEDETI